MSSDEFWNLSPREFEALIQEFREEQRFWNLRFGVVAAATYNVNRDVSKFPDPIPPLSLFGEKEEERELTPEEFAEQLDSVLQSVQAAFQK